MKFPRSKRRLPFSMLPRHKRREAVIRLKGKIRRDATEYGGHFTSHLVLNEPGRPDLYNQWFNFYFPGTDKFTIWNAYFITARKAFWNKLQDIAFNRAYAQLTAQEREENFKWEFVPAERSNTGKILTYKLAERQPMRFEQFSGRTFREQWHKLESEIARDEPPLIYESFKLERGYVYGIGLSIVLDVDVINQVTIESAIERFIAIGETDWTSSEPVPTHRLPVISEDEALAAVHWQPASFL